MTALKPRLIALALAAVALTFQVPAGAAERQVPQSDAQITLSFAPLVKQAAPAVVNVLTQRLVQQRSRSPLFDDPFFRRFFGNELGGPRRQESAVGSGVIVEPEGLIVTNHHVIAGADAIRVVLADRREFDAELVLDDERTDLAVLKIEAPDTLPHIELANSDNIEVGDLVLAIGNPFGVGQTVTSGIVSALARTNVGITDFNFFIQTDAAINPGNSGGALLTMDGALAGINTAIFSRSGGSQGIGFAVPANMVRTVLGSVGQAGIVRRPWLGALGEPVTADLAESLGLDRPGGVLVNQVYPGGPADRAGVAPGDVITGIDGRQVIDEDSLRFRLATGALGSTVDLQVLRDGSERALTFPLEAAPETPPRDVAELGGNQPLAGATVVNLSPAVAEELGESPMATGVIVTQVAARSPASSIGLRPRDVIVDINGRSVADVAELRRLVDARRRLWQIGIRRGGRVLSVTVSG